MVEWGIEDAVSRGRRVTITGGSATENGGRNGDGWRHGTVEAAHRSGPHETMRRRGWGEGRVGRGTGSDVRIGTGGEGIGTTSGMRDSIGS